LKHERPKIETESGERSPCTPVAICTMGSAVSSLSGVWGGARPQMHFWRTESPKTRLSGILPCRSWILGERGWLSPSVPRG